jgi:hypothetical protein
MSRPHIEKGIFLRGGTYPARIAHTPSREQPWEEPHFRDDVQILDHPAFIKEMKGRIQNLKEALGYIGSERPSAEETQEEWLRRMGYL